MRGWREILTLLGVAVIPAGLTAWLHPRVPSWAWHRPEVEQVSPAEVQRWGAAVLWIDARSAAEFAREHIPGALPLNETEWERLFFPVVAQWQPEHRIVVYCDSQRCNASTEVALRLRRELNATQVFVLHGGWSAWQRLRATPAQP